MKKLLPLFIVALLALHACFAKPAADNGVPLMEKARAGALANGLRYYILANGTPENRAYLTLAVHAGSVLETDEEQGLAHFVEHMAFNGTARFPGNELDDYLQSLGMRLGADSNAHTGFDATVYGIVVPTETGADGVKSLPEKALNIVDDWTHAVLFTEKDVDDERPIILEEKRMRTNAVTRIFQEHLMPLLFAGSPYADRMPIGKESVIQNAPASRLRGFYRKWYRTDNMALIIVGDFDAAALESSLGRYFSAPKPETPLEHPAYDLPPPQKGRLEARVFTDSELTSAAVYLYYKRRPKAVAPDMASYRESALDYLASYVINERLDEAARDPEAPFTQAFADGARYGESSRFFVAGAGAKTGAAEETVSALLREMERLFRYGVTEDEAGRAKAALISAAEAEAAEEKRESEDFVAAFTSHFLERTSAPDAAWELDALQKMLPRIKTREISAYARDYFSGNDLSVFLLGPDSEALPSEERLRDMARAIKKAKKSEVAPVKQAALDADILKKTPAPGTIASESVDQETRTLVWVLGNGARVLVKPTANKQDEVALYALARGGVSATSGGSAVLSARLAPEFLAESGAGPYSGAELNKMLAARQASLSFRASAYLRTLSGASTVKDLETLFKLLHLNFTAPRIDDSALEVVLSRHRAYLANQENDPEAVFGNEITRAIFGDSVYFRPLELGDMARVNAADARAFVKKALNPADFTFVFTGSIDVDRLRTLALTYLASIDPLPQKWSDWTELEPPAILSGAGNVVREIKKGKDDKSIVYLSWLTREAYTEENAAAAAALSEYLDTVFNTQIREKLGGVYSIYANVSLSPLPPYTLALDIYFPCDPKSADSLVRAVEGELKALESKIDGDALAKARETVKKTWETSVQENAYIAQSYANSAVIYRSPLSRLDKRPLLYENITAKDLQAAATKLLAASSIRLTLYPEN